MKVNFLKSCEDLLSVKVMEGVKKAILEVKTDYLVTVDEEDGEEYGIEPGTYLPKSLDIYYNSFTNELIAESHFDNEDLTSFTPVMPLGKPHNYVD